MKQSITPEQLNELSDKGKEKLMKWVFKKNKGGFGNPYSTEPSIGEMIEFLDVIILNRHTVGWQIEGGYYEKKELSDALWEACKEILK